MMTDLLDFIDKDLGRFHKKVKFYIKFQSIVPFDTLTVEQNSENTVLRIRIQIPNPESSIDSGSGTLIVSIGMLGSFKMLSQLDHPSNCNIEFRRKIPTSKKYGRYRYIFLVL